MMTETLLPQPDGMAPRGEWRKLNYTNNTCPGCGKQIKQSDTNICYSRTKRKTSVFWHIGCTKKVWG